MTANVRAVRKRPRRQAGGYNRRLNIRKLEAVVARHRLESWKEVAAYLNRSERTVRRWEEKEGLPVHRLQHDKRGSVYAYTSELDEWRESRKQLLEAEPAANAAAPERRWPWKAVAGSVILLLASAIGFWWFEGSSTTAAYTPDPDAVRLVQRANFGGNAGRVQIETSTRYFQEAIELDPKYAAAWSGLATAHIVSIWFGETEPKEMMAMGKREAREALRLDPSSGSAWRTLAFAEHYNDWDHAAAETHFRKAIELSPNGAVELSWYADFLTDLRRFDEARTYYKRAQDSSPRWLEPITFAANTYTFTGNPDVAIASQERVLELEPNFGLGIHYLGRSYLAKRDFTRALAHLRKSNEVLGKVPFSVGDLAYAVALSGEHAEARRMIDEMLARRAKGYYPAFPIAQAYLGLGESETALEWLHRAADEHHLGFYLPSADPIYDPVRSHPSFRKLMERMNLQMTNDQ